VLNLFRQGELIYTSHLAYKPTTSERRRKRLAAQYHQQHRNELAKLSQIHRQREQSLETERDYLLACGFLKYGMIQEAIALLEALVETGECRSVIQATLGKVYLRLQKYELAGASFQQALAAHSNYADLHFYFGLCEYHLQHCAAAVCEFERALEINPYYGESHFYLGLTFLLNAKLGQEYELAKNLDERAAKSFSTSHAILPALQNEAFDLGMQLLEQKKVEEAYNALAPLAAQISADKPEAMNYEFHLAVLHEAEQIRPEQVWQEIDRLRRLLQHYPDYADVYHELGVAYAVLGVSVTSKALAHFEKALQINPAYAQARKNLKLMQYDQRGLRTMLNAMLPRHVANLNPA
jgi:tetratricopeptide (TPR) repeat protein